MDSLSDMTLLEIASEVIHDGHTAPARVDRSGQFHYVVVLPGVAAVRIARDETAAAALPRRMALVERLARFDLPFAVPRPLGPVQSVNGRVVVATEWVDGGPYTGGHPGSLRDLLDALAAVDVRALSDVLDVPHAYAGRERWPELMSDEVVPRLPHRWRDDARRRVDAALALEPVEPSLVHGDLAGANVHWRRGSVVGVLDWDLAAAFDPAVDAACLAGHGWPAVRAAVDSRTYERALVWFETFALEQVAAVIADGETPATVDDRIRRTVQWLERNAGATDDG